jgi:gas vesicle protein
MKDNSGKVLLALLAGAGAGVIAGLLMAPDTGEATRDTVKKWAGKVSKDLEKNLQTSLDEIKNMSNNFGKTDFTKSDSSAQGSGSSAGNNA